LSARDPQRSVPRLEPDYPASRYSGWQPRSGALLLTGSPADDELDVVTVPLHTTALRGNRWELDIPKPFLKPGAFHLQQVQTVSTIKLERRLGSLSADEMKGVLTAVSDRLRLENLKQH